MKNHLLLIALLFLLGGCGGDNHGTRPIIMRGELYFSSETKRAKVALVSLDSNDNWVTVSTSRKISNGSHGWNWGSFSLDLPIVDRDSVYDILPYNDKNGNNKYDEVDYENLIESFWYYAVYYADTNTWEVWNYNDEYMGKLPGYVLEIEADYSKAGLSSVQSAVAPKTMADRKRAYKALRMKVEGY